MLLLLAKRKHCSVIRPLFHAHLHHHPLFSCCGYASATQKPTNFMMVDYLIASFGFSPDKAAIISKPIAHLKTSQKPDAVRCFLNHHGFSEAGIKTVVSLYPRILCASPENTLEPNIEAIRDIGLASSTLTQLILADPGTLKARPAVSRIKFWRDFFGGNEAALVKAFRNNVGLGNHDISRAVSPKISLLQSHGLSSRDIQKIVLQAPRLIISRISLLENSLKRAKELGFQPKSGMFAAGLRAMNAVNRESLQKKMQLFKGFGWTEDQFVFALRKAPYMVTLTENNLHEKMNFLLGEARCDPSYIASYPVLLMMSLEKRLRPRLHVLHLLDSKGLSSIPGLVSVMLMTNIEFVGRFILTHKAEMLGLHEDYLAATGICL